MVVVCYQRANEFGIAIPGPDLAQLGSAKLSVVSKWKRLDQPSQVYSFADGGSNP